MNNNIVDKKQLNCAREVINYSSIGLSDRFDKPKFNSDKFLEDLIIKSPKLLALLDKIAELDENDYKKEKKLYKHFIFSDIKKGYGAKIIASALIATDYTLVMKKQKSSIVLDYSIIDDEENESKFAVLSSTALWDNPVQPKLTKEILSIFNSRPDNVYGDKIRIIILDSGFKEGIDLFDVKYAHIFEDQMTQADLTQSLGRSLRFCGQKGLPYNNGWKVNAYIYKLYKTTPRDLFKLKIFKGKEGILDYIKKQDKELSFNLKFEAELNNIIKKSAIDLHLNENINKINKKRNIGEIIKSTIIPFIGLALLSTLLRMRYINKSKNKL